MPFAIVAITREPNSALRISPRTPKRLVLPVAVDGAQAAADVEGADDRRDDPAAERAEEVVGRVVDRVVLDHDDALGDRPLDDALPDLEAGQRHDERRHADQRDHGTLAG